MGERAGIALCLMTILQPIGARLQRMRTWQRTRLHPLGE